MKSVEESGLSFGISRLLNACAEQNGLIVNPAHLQLTANSSAHPSSLQNNLSLFQQSHPSYTNNQSLDIENNSNHSKSSLNGETKLTNNENTLNLMNSFTHYNNMTNHATNESFLNSDLKTPIDAQLKGNFKFYYLEKIVIKLFFFNLKKKVQMV